jgi:hypothetical protein
LEMAQKEDEKKKESGEVTQEVILNSHKGV